MPQARRVNSEILVNTAVDGAQLLPQITALANGGFVVTWIDLSEGVGGAQLDASGAAVKAQVFNADGSPEGPEILVNTTTSESQVLPEITALSGGGFAISWTDASETPGGAPSIFDVRAQVFNAGGGTVGGEILVNTATAGEQAYQQIAALSDDGFVVTWADSSAGVGGAAGDTSGFAIKAQVFAAGGSPLGSEILVNTATASDQFAPMIAALPEGRFVVAWEDYSEGVGGDDSGYAIKAQVFEADGSKIGQEILVNTALEYDQWLPQITVLKSGGFVIAWEDGSEGIGGADGDTSYSAVKAQVFGGFAEGFAPAGPEILVNTATAGDQIEPKITALSNGGFVVAWDDTSEGQGIGGAKGDSSSYAVKAQVFGSDGAPVGQEILVNTAWINAQYAPEIAALPAGGFVVTWSDRSYGVGGAGGDSSGFAVKAQLFADDGSRIGTEFRVNTATQGDQSNAQIAALENNGGFVVTWDDTSEGVGGAGGDASYFAVKAQVFVIGPSDPDPTPEPPAITLAQVKAAHLNVLGLSLSDAAAQGILADIAKGSYSFDGYIGTLVDKADLSTLPAVITNALLAGVAPTQGHLPELGAFVTAQYGAYQTMARPIPRSASMRRSDMASPEPSNFRTITAGSMATPFSARPIRTCSAGLRPKPRSRISRRSLPISRGSMPRRGKAGRWQACTPRAPSSAR